MNMIQAMHNKYEKIFKENLETLEFNDGDSKQNPEESKNIVVRNIDYSKKIDDLRNLCINTFDNNKRVYKSNRKKRRIKMLMFYDLPFVAFIAASYFALSSPKKSEIVPVYHVKQTMISEDKVVTDIDDTNYVIPAFDEILSDAKFVEIENTKTEIQYQIKNGTDNKIVSIRVNNNGQLEVYRYLSGNFYDSNVAVFKYIDASEVEDKYQEIIDDIADYMLNESNYLNSTQKQAIKDALEDEKSMIINTFVEYFNDGEVETIESTKKYSLRLLGREAICLAGYVVIMAIIAAAKGFKINKITFFDTPNLSVSSDDKFLFPFKTAREERNTFIDAEKLRRGKIEDFAYNNLEGESKKKFLSK